MERVSRRALAPALLLWVLALSGCLSVGREFPTGPVTSLQIGETTQDDVRAAFGPPWRTGIEDGDRTWTYGHYRYALLGLTHTRDLVLRFDERGVLRSYTYNSTTPDGP